MNRRSSCLLNIIRDLLISQNNFDLFLLLPYNSRTPLFLTNFSQSVPTLRCGLNTKICRKNYILHQSGLLDAVLSGESEATRKIRRTIIRSENPYTGARP